MIKRPMLASPADLEKIAFPVLASTKLDGIRCIVFDGVPYSRNLKPIPNKHIRAFFGQFKDEFHGYDGELLVGDATAHGAFQVSTSGIMSHEGEPDFNFHVFDRIGQEPYQERLSQVTSDHPQVHPLPHYLIESFEDLMRFEEAAVKAGYEGVMLRHPEGPYKEGRSTAKEGYLLKVKRFFDAEAVVIDVHPLESNQNEAKVNKLGLTERSTHKAGKVAQELLGKLTVRARFHMPHKDPHAYFSTTFKIGSGFTAAQRAELWALRDDLRGKLVTFKYQELTVDGVPRFPTFKGFRED